MLLGVLFLSTLSEKKILLSVCYRVMADQSIKRSVVRCAVDNDYAKLTSSVMTTNSTLLFSHLVVFIQPFPYAR